jgi:hypothetical protein
MDGWTLQCNRNTRTWMGGHYNAKIGQEIMSLNMRTRDDMMRCTNLMQQLWFIIINISTCFGHLYAHLQEYSLYATAYGVQH